MIIGLGTQPTVTYGTKNECLEVLGATGGFGVTTSECEYSEELERFVIVSKPLPFGGGLLLIGVALIALAFMIRR